MNAAEHVEIAELQISKAISEMEIEEATSIVHAMLAQARATLALVELQRIANIIAYTHANGAEPSGEVTDMILEGLKL